MVKQFLEKDEFVFVSFDAVVFIHISSLLFRSIFVYWHSSCFSFLSLKKKSSVVEMNSEKKQKLPSRSRRGCFFAITAVIFFLLLFPFLGDITVRCVRERARASSVVNEAKKSARFPRGIWFAFRWHTPPHLVYTENATVASRGSRLTSRWPVFLSRNKYRNAFA